MIDALHALRNVDFNWATKLQDIWHDDPADVAGLNGHLRGEVEAELDRMVDDPTHVPLGRFFIGGAGSGKTHLLSAVRRQAAERRAGFILVDMTDVRDFWDVVLQGFLDSLQTPYADGKFQHVVLMHQFISQFARDKAAKNLELLAKRKTKALANDVRLIIGVLRQRWPREALSFRDTIRALICLNSQDYEIAATGYSWLQGQEIESELATELGFSDKQKRAIELVESLSWFMSLGGPMVVGFDQLDPIVQQLRFHQHSPMEGDAAEAGTALSIVEQIAAGLSAIRDKTRRSLILITGVENTYEQLAESVSRAYLDRYETRALHRRLPADVFGGLIRGRLAPAYAGLGLKPPYPTWPFHPDAIDGLTSESPREVLKLCQKHRNRCLEAGQVFELRHFGDAETSPPPTASRGDDGSPPIQDRLGEIDDMFRRFRDEAEPAAWLDEKHDDQELAPLYRVALESLVLENESKFPGDVDLCVEREFAGGRSTRPLHARLRVVHHHEDSREEHYCVRAVQRGHHSAFCSRIKAAMTQSGIDKALRFRHLVVIRTADVPGGVKTKQLIDRFREAGGRFHSPDEEELRTLAAVRRLIEENTPRLEDWLRQRRPVTGAGLGSILTPGLAGFAASGAGDGEGPPEPTPPARQDLEPIPTAQRDLETAAPVVALAPEPAKDVAPIRDPFSGPTHALSFGRRMPGLDTFGDEVALPLELLTKHTMILGGSGSGKSVTIRRIVEEAALAGIPSLIIDGAQDLCLFDTDWDAPPDGWKPGDDRRASSLRQRLEQVVWTPGSLGNGNPLVLRPLPDFTPVRDNQDELEAAIAMACDGLLQLVGRGKSDRARHSEGILRGSMRHFARNFPAAGMDGYIRLLEELPEDARLHIDNEAKLARQMASNFKVARVSNPLWGEQGVPLDPNRLFGDDAVRDTVRVSVVSLAKLMSLDNARSFLNQLAMTLFSWIKQNPKPPGDRPLRGLLVIDEARDFVPSGKSTECKESLMRLAAQARKYRLGMVLATQHPKDVETKIVGNCATHLYGLNNSPASLATLDELMRQKGGSGGQIPRLKAGQFFIHNADAGHQAPIKIQVPMSLTLSPPTPLEESRIMDKASTSRSRLEPV